MHLLFRKLSEDLNFLGLDAKVILKPTYQLWWTPEMIKRDLWKPLQKVMLGKESTTELTSEEVTKVYEQLAKVIGEKHGVEIEFPNQEDLERMKFYEKK